MSEKIMVNKESVAYRLFLNTMNELRKEIKDLDDNFNIARNLACSDWKAKTYFAGSILEPYKMHPKRMDLIHKNVAILREEISLRCYLAIKAFQPLVGQSCLTTEWKDCYDFWEKKIGKKDNKTDFELKDRFNETK